MKFLWKTNFEIFQLTQSEILLFCFPRPLHFYLILKMWPKYWVSQTNVIHFKNFYFLFSKRQRAGNWFLKLHQWIPSGWKALSQKKNTNVVYLSDIRCSVNQEYWEYCIIAVAKPTFYFCLLNKCVNWAKTEISREVLSRYVVANPTRLSLHLNQIPFSSDETVKQV